MEKPQTASLIKPILLTAVLCLLFAGGVSAANAETYFLYQKISDDSLDGVWTYGAATVTITDGVIYPGDPFVPGTYKRGGNSIYVTYPQEPGDEPGDDEKTFYKNVVITPSGDLKAGQKVTGSFKMIIPGGSMSTSDKVTITSPLADLKISADILRGGVSIVNDYQSSTLSGFMLESSSDLTVEVTFSGTVSENSKGTHINVVKVVNTVPRIGSYESPKQPVYPLSETPVTPTEKPADLVTYFLYQKTSDNSLEGTWTYGAATVTITDGVIYPGANFVPGTYKKGADAIYVTYPQEPGDDPEDEPAVQPSIILKAGWNFISVPRYLDTSCDTAKELFSTLDTGGLSPIGHDAKTGWYLLKDDTPIKPLNGYWVYSKVPAEIPITYSTAVNAPPSKPVYKGWNAVGLSADKSMTANSAFSNLEWDRCIPWDVKQQKWGTVIINGASPENSEEMKLELGSGNWLYVEEDGTYLGNVA